MCESVYVHVHQKDWKGLESITNAEAKHPDVDMKCYFLSKKAKLVRSWLTPSPGQKMYKMTLEHLIIPPESKKAIKEYQDHLKRTQANLKRFTIVRHRAI